MPVRSTRVLVAEDYQPFRRFLVTTVQSLPELQVACEVEDGAGAVQKAAELQPELVLLDIGLPKLNGIQAAKQIREVSPNSKILFVSQESSADIVQAALETGARGYVAKTDAGRELIPAIDAVLRGQTYVSKSLAAHDLTKISDRSAVQPSQMQPVSCAGCGPFGLQTTRHHEVGFYADDRSLVEAYTHFVGTSLKSGKAAIVVLTEAHRDKLLGGLQAYGLDMRTAIEQGRYVALDNAETIAEFMVDGLPDPAKFSRATVDLITRTAKSVNGKTARVVACGECAPLLWQRGNAEGAVRLEELWNPIARSYGVQVFCGYPLGCLPDRTGSHTFERICAAHSRVL
jgi:DNA-binding NarL/FixJ family response regulator